MCRLFDRVRDEVDSVIGERHEVSFEDISKLEYCSLAIKESLRLYPPAAFTFRKVDHEFKINGMPIPNGTDVAVSRMAISTKDKKNTSLYLFIAVTQII